MQVWVLAKFWRTTIYHHALEEHEHTYHLAPEACKACVSESDTYSNIQKSCMLPC